MPYKDPQKNKECKKKYYQEHKEETKEYKKKWYQEHKEEIRESQKKWRQEHPEYNKKYYQIHKKERLEYDQIHKKEQLEYNKEYQKERRKIDPKFRLDQNMRNMIYNALKNNKAGRHWETLVGYTIIDLIVHLEKQFDSKMNWENYGKYWDVDHWKPKSLFHYTFPEDPQFKECWALKNLQPLEHIANMRKFNHF